MKTIINKYTFIICFVCFLTNQLICQTQPFLSFQENLNLPQDNLGVMPECIVEVNDVIDEIPVHKLYVYGMGGILIYNLNSTNWWLFPEKIAFSEQPYGYYDRSLFFDLVNHTARQPMIYVPEEKGFGQLFAVGPDLRLWCINVANDQAEHVLTSSQLSGLSLISSKLVYDPINTRIMWLVNANSESTDEDICYLIPVSLTNYSIGTPIDIPGTISDFAINDDITKNFMYFGLIVNDSQRYWVVRERNSLGPIASYPLSFLPGLIRYVHTNDNHSNEIHQVYCLPASGNTQLADIYIFNGDSPSHSYLTITSPVHGYMSSAFNDVRNHLFLGAYSDINTPVFNDVYIFQCQNNLAPTPLCTLNTNGYSTEKQNLPFSIDPVNGDENLIMKRHEIVKLNYTEGTQCHYAWQSLSKSYGNFFGNADPTNDSRVFITSMSGGGFLEYLTNTTPWTLRIHQTGQAVHSCFTSENSGKSYYFSKEHTANSNIFFDKDLTLWSFTGYTYQNPIGDCIYNPFQHHILISDYLGSPNPSLNAYAEVQGGLSWVSGITINETHNGEMFITDDGKLLFFSGGNNVNPKVNIRSALNYNLQLGQINLTKSEFSASDQLEVLFAGNPYQNYFVVSDIYSPDGSEPLQPTSAISYFYTLNPANLSASPSIQIQHDAPKFLEAMYTTTPNRSLPFYAYVGGSESVISEVYIDNQTLAMSVFQISISNPLSTMKLVSYSGENGDEHELYLVTRPNETTSKLYKYIPGSQEPPDLIAEINSIISSMSFNDQTGLLYCYGTDIESSLVYQFDVMNQYDNESQGLTLKRMANEKFASNFFYKGNEMICDNENHEVFIPNGDHSSISRLGFAFVRIHIKLKDKVAWLSFPRLENQGYSAQTELEGIRPFPSYIYMENLPLQQEAPELKTITYQAPSWTEYGLNTIQSTFGYKLGTDNQYVSYLPMTGNILDPSTTVTIYQGHENWVGYFPTWPQDPFDALAGILDQLTLIKHHDWVCVKDQCRGAGPGGPPNYCWICSITTPLEYADMLILECSEDVTFQWGEELSAESREITETEHYTYAEKFDYTPIFIELDSNDHPLEIGAFVADSCIGATVVEEGDSSIMLRGYMPDDTAGIITFERYYGLEKRFSDRISDYYVQNNQTRIREKRAIDSREKGHYYLVSFKNENNSLLSTNPLVLNFNPNPCQGYCSIEYFLPVASDITFEVYDVYGRKINKIFLENEQAGNYAISWSKLVPGPTLPGIYVIRLSACGQSITKKVIITK